MRSELGYCGYVKHIDPQGINLNPRFNLRYPPGATAMDSHLDILVRHISQAVQSQEQPPAKPMPAIATPTGDDRAELEFHLDRLIQDVLDAIQSSAQ